VVLSIVLAVASSSPALAQRRGGEPAKDKDQQGQAVPPAGGEDDSNTRGPAKGERDKEQTKKAAVDSTKAQAKDQNEQWKDANAASALENTFPELKSPAAPFTAADKATLLSMAAGQANVDRALIKKYLDTQAAILTRHEYIQAMLDGVDEGKPELVRKIEEAGKALIQPLTAANNPRSINFRDAYLAELVSVVQQLLRNHLFARIQGIIALSRTASADQKVIDAYISILKDPKQTLFVKGRAATGLVLAADRGRVALDAGNKAIPAARALADFLENDESNCYPIKAKALEALGALRQSTQNPGQPQAEFAAVALRYLSDPQAHPDLRTWAAWALGMMTINPQAKFNFNLVAGHIGQAAADIGERIVKADAAGNSGQVEHLTDLELWLLESLVGGPPAGVPTGLSNSNHPNFGSSRAFTEGVQQRVQAIAQAAIALTRSGGAARADDRKKVAAYVQDMGVFLAKNPPASRSLVPGGPEFPGPQAQVAAGDKK